MTLNSRFPQWLHFLSKCECSPLNPSKVFSDPPFGFSVTTDPPFCSPKNQVIPSKILPSPLPAINNDQSLSFSSLIAHETSRTHTYCHVSFKKGIPTGVSPLNTAEVDKGHIIFYLLLLLVVAVVVVIVLVLFYLKTIHVPSEL